MVEMSHFATFSVFLVLALLSWRDLMRPADAQVATKDIPTPKFSAFAGPTIKFLYWYVEIRILWRDFHSSRPTYVTPLLHPLNNKGCKGHA